VAFTDTVTVPETVAPSEGEVIEIDGAVLSIVLRTVTDTVLVELFPFASRAVALKT
jgi:hypothetical protein